MVMVHRLIVNDFHFVGGGRTGRESGGDGAEDEETEGGLGDTHWIGSGWLVLGLG